MCSFVRDSSFIFVIGIPQCFPAAGEVNVYASEEGLVARAAGVLHICLFALAFRQISQVDIL